MGKIGLGYGSEWHLLRYLGRHRQLLNCEIKKVIGGKVVEWLDFGFDPNDKQRIFDTELQGIEFLPRDSAILKEWHEFCPQTGKAQNWDAVGRIEIQGKSYWFLVEAKSHLEELISDCMARDAGLEKIRKTLTNVRSEIGINSKHDWLERYYQYCNRIAVRHFLQSHKIDTKLLFIYFTGDRFPANKIDKSMKDNGICGSIKCPQDIEQWENGFEGVKGLRDMYEHIGVCWERQRELGIYKIFLPVNGESTAAGRR